MDKDDSSSKESRHSIGSEPARTMKDAKNQKSITRHSSSRYGDRRLMFHSITQLIASATMSFRVTDKELKSREGARKEKLVRSTQAPFHHPTNRYKDINQENIPQKLTIGVSLRKSRHGEWEESKKNTHSMSHTTSYLMLGHPAARKID